MNNKLKKVDNISSEKVDSDIILFNDENNIILNLNETASIIWELIDSYEATDELLNAFINYFDINNRPDINIISNDFKKVIDKLYEHRVITFF